MVLKDDWKYGEERAKVCLLLCYIQLGLLNLVYILLYKSN